LAIAEKSLVNEAADSWGTLAVPPPELPCDEEPLGVEPPPPQAAAARVVAASTAPSETFLKTRTVAPSLIISSTARRARPVDAGGGVDVLDGNDERVNAP
jgi:hypothetical protein